jgi:quercetin dioxygenase-like cupin family protein
VPWHAHSDRPALILISSGQITEYASTCAVPIVHKAGDITAERHPTSHWWKNHGTTPVVIHSFDLFRSEDKKNEKMM